MTHFDAGRVVTMCTDDEDLDAICVDPGQLAASQCVMCPGIRRPVEKFSPGSSSADSLVGDDHQRGPGCDARPNSYTDRMERLTILPEGGFPDCGVASSHPS